MFARFAASKTSGCFQFLLFLSNVTAAIRVQKVGVVIAPGFEMLDALGPYETLKEVQQKYYSQIDIHRRTWGTPMDIKCADEHGELEITVEFVATFTFASVGEHIETPLKSIDTPSSSGIAIIPEFYISVDPDGTRFDLLIFVVLENVFCIDYSVSRMPFLRTLYFPCILLYIHSLTFHRLPFVWKKVK